MAELPKLRSDLVVAPTTIDGEVVYNIKDPRTGNYFRLREPEYWLISRFDGNTSPETLAARFRETYRMNMTADAVRKFIGVMAQLFFLENAGSEQKASRLSYEAGRARSRLGKLLFLKLHGFNPGRFLDRLTALYRPFHRPIWFVLQVAVIAIGLWVFFGEIGHFTVDLYELFNVGSIVIIVLSLFLLVTLHEFAHAVICRLHGGEVREIGFLLIYFQPSFYCDVSDAWLFPRKSQRLAVTFAGPYFQLLLLVAAALVWRVTIPGTFVNELASTLVIVCWVTFLFNFNPLIKLDGYYLVSDWLDIPNLRRKAFAFLKNVIQRRLLGWPVPVQQVSGRERRIYLSYSILAGLYSGLLIGWLLWLVAGFVIDWGGGRGFILLCLVLFLMLRSSLAGLGRGLVTHVGHMKGLLKRPGRLSVWIIVIAAIVVLLFVVPFPHRVSGEVSVRPLSSFTVSINDLGLLETTWQRGGKEPESKSSFLQMTSSDLDVLDLLPLISDGDSVKPGDTIAVLTSNQIMSEVATGRAELERLQGELRLLKAPPKQEEIDEAEAQVTKARSNLQQLQRDLKRVGELVNKGLEASERLESAQSAVDVAGAELDNKESALRLLKSPPRPEEEAVLRHEIQKQQARLDFLFQQAAAQHIITPIGGSVSADRNSVNMIKVSDRSYVELQVPVSDFDITLVELGQPVSVKVRSYPSRTFYGIVVRVPRAADADHGGHFPVSVVVANDLDLLRDGMTGYAKIEVGRASLASLALRKAISTVRVEFWSWW